MERAFVAPPTAPASAEPDPEVLARLSPRLRELHALTRRVRMDLDEEMAGFDYALLLSTRLRNGLIGEAVSASDRRDGAVRLMARIRDELRDVADEVDALDAPDKTMLAERGFTDERVRWLARDTGAESRKFSSLIRGTRNRVRRARTDLDELERALLDCAQLHPYR